MSPGRILGLAALLAGAWATDAPAQQPTSACAAAAAFLGAEAEAATLVRDTSFADPLAAGVRRGCSLGLETSWARSAAAPHPAERIRAGLQALGWREDLHYAADGPDGTAFALRHGTAVCFVAARWDGGDDSDPTYVPSDQYSLLVRCTGAG